ncbi:MAG: hypothetical protein EOP02_38200 [Proteobacteria bacterium]|nr:MAG: hypothetical protein EOP02_38200 [Pseudomonadota bacterium]
MARSDRSKRSSGRDAGGFVALPWAVLDSPAFLKLSHPAKALLLELARQCHGDDNGRLLLSRVHLASRGWKSADVIQRAKTELLEAEFVFQTVQGCRPNKASWYAVTWHKLGKLQGFDPGIERAFRQGAYRKNDVLCPSPGQGRAPIAPSPGQGSASPVPSPGAIRGKSGTSSVPSAGHPLEMPSPAAV